MDRTCSEAPTREVLEDVLDVTLPEDATFQSAHDRAWSEARDRLADPMLLAWYDGVRGAHAPPVDCCGKDRPAWLVYAQSRGAALTVSVNEERFVFVFRPGIGEGAPTA